MRLKAANAKLIFLYKLYSARLCHIGIRSVAIYCDVGKSLLQFRELTGAPVEPLRLRQAQGALNPFQGSLL